MATTNQKESQGVSQHQRLAMGAKLDGQKLPGTPVKTATVPK